MYLLLTLFLLFFFPSLKTSLFYIILKDIFTIYKILGFTGFEILNFFFLFNIKDVIHCLQASIVSGEVKYISNFSFVNNL